MKILLAYDGSESADLALQDLTNAALPENIDLTVLSAGELDITDYVGGVVDALFAASGDKLNEFVEEERLRVMRQDVRARARIATLLPQANVSILPVIRQPENAILEYAEEHQVDLIVVGSHGKGMIQRALLGSVSSQVLREAPCSVRIVKRAVSRSSGIRVVVGYDGSHHAERMLKKIAVRTWPTDTLFSVVYVNDLAAIAQLYGITSAAEISWNPHLGKEDLTIANAGADILRTARWNTEVQIRYGRPKVELLRAARDWDADLILVAARGMGRLERLVLGSVSQAVAHHAETTVEVVR